MKIRKLLKKEKEIIPTCLEKTFSVSIQIAKNIINTPPNNIFFRTATITDVTKSNIKDSKPNSP